MPSQERGSGDYGWPWDIPLRTCSDVACCHRPRVCSSARLCEGIKTQVCAAMVGWVLKDRTPGHEDLSMLGGARTPRTCLLVWRTCVGGGGGSGSWLEVIFSLASHGNFLSVRWVCDNTFLPSDPATVSVGPHEFTSEVHTSCPSPAAPCLAGSGRGGLTAPSGPCIVPGQLW